MAKTYKSIVLAKIKADNFLIGVTCGFVSLSSTRGLKLFRSKKAFESTIENQRRAANLGLGPRVIKVVKIAKIKTKIYGHFQRTWKYAFITEKCNLIDEPSKKEIMVLKRKLNKHDLGGGDIMKDHNCGYLRGKLVCYDFDPVSVSCELTN